MIIGEEEIEVPVKNAKRSGTEKRKLGKVVQTRVTQEVYAKMKIVAGDCDCTIAELARDYLSIFDRDINTEPKARRPRRQVPPDLVVLQGLRMDLNRLGNGLNQVARLARDGQQIELGFWLNGHLTDLKAALEKLDAALNPGAVGA